MPTESTAVPRRVFRRMSIGAGNFLQIAGFVFSALALALARSSKVPALAATGMLLAWILLYFCCHGIAHWIAGRMVGIRFAFYTIGGTGNPAAYPPGLRWIFERLPFFGVQTEKASMQAASPGSRALMWCAGVTSSAVVPTLAAICCRQARVPGSKMFLIFAIAWALGTLASNWTSRTGDFSKARRALAGA